MSRYPVYNNAYGTYNGVNQEGPPRSLTDVSWTYPPVVQPPLYGPQYPTPQPQPPMQVAPQFNPGMARGGPIRPSTFRPIRPKQVVQTGANAQSWPRSKAEWLSKIDCDTPSTVIDFKQPVEEGGAQFSDRVKFRTDNLKAVGGDILMSICKAATSSAIDGTVVGIEGEVEELGSQSLAEKVLAIEELESKGRSVDKKKL